VSEHTKARGCEVRANDLADRRSIFIAQATTHESRGSGTAQTTKKLRISPGLVCSESKPNLANLLVDGSHSAVGKSSTPQFVNP